MRLLELLVPSVGIFSLAFGTYVTLPTQYKYQVSDWYARIGAPPYHRYP